MYERTKLSFTNRTKLSFTALLASLQWQCSLSLPSATQTSSVISVFFRFFNWKRHVFHLSHKHSRRRSQKQKLVVFSIELSPLEMDDHSQVPSRNFKTRWSSEDFRFLHFPHLMPHKHSMMENWPKPHDVPVTVQRSTRCGLIDRPKTQQLKQTVAWSAQNFGDGKMFDLRRI